MDIWYKFSHLSRNALILCVSSTSQDFLLFWMGSMDAIHYIVVCCIAYKNSFCASSLSIDLSITFYCIVAYDFTALVWDKFSSFVKL